MCIFNLLIFFWEEIEFFWGYLIETAFKGKFGLWDIDKGWLLLTNVKSD